MPNRLTSTIAASAALLAMACSQPDEDNAGRSDSEVQLYRLAGTVAVGRPGAWAEVCIEDDCSRANSEGVYRLLSERRRSALMQAEFENADQTKTALTSLYRHETDQITALLNINPTTDALLDSWSRYRLGQTLETCAQSTPCTNNLISSFTPDMQQAAQQQLQAWLAPRWETVRDPFTDPYIADPALDWLDELHDHLNLKATETGLSAIDNENDTLATLAYARLFETSPPVIAIAPDTLSAAYAIAPVLPRDTNPITINYQASPSSPFTLPIDWQVDVRNSRSLFPGELRYNHTLVGPNGRVTTGTGGQFFSSLRDPGPFTWTVVVTDSEGNQATDGLALRALASDVITDPSFGAEGSCRTSPLTANASNVCISTTDGGSLGACIADTSGSTRTQYSPAACSPVSQQAGIFLGTCTSVLNQVRIYHYDNPLRDTGETVIQQQQRLQNQCVNSLGRDWSAVPPE